MRRYNASKEQLGDGCHASQTFQLSGANTQNEGGGASCPACPRLPSGARHPRGTWPAGQPQCPQPRDARRLHAPPTSQRPPDPERPAEGGEPQLQIKDGGLRPVTDARQECIPAKIVAKIDCQTSHLATAATSSSHQLATGRGRASLDAQSWLALPVADSRRLGLPFCQSG